MFSLIDHIEYLMMSNDCVVIPGWGALIAQYSEPQYRGEAHHIEKPYRQVGFNASVNHNDGLLANSIARRERVPYDQAVRMIDQSVTLFRRQLADGQELSMGRLGFFQPTADGQAEFVPFFHEMCGDQYFGLRSVTFTPLDVLKRQEEARAAATAAFADAAKPAGNTHPANWWLQRPWQAAVSIVALLALTMLLTTPIIVNQQQHNASLTIAQKSHDSQQPTVDWDTLTNHMAVALPTPGQQSQATTPSEGNYYLVVSSLSSQQQVDNYLAIHSDLANRLQVLKRSDNLYYVYVARSANSAELHAIKAQLPQAYHKAWIYN